jgi:hypothetical protein
VFAGTVTYTVKLHNYGGAAATLASSNLNVTTDSASGTLECTPSVPKDITGTIAAGADGSTTTVTCDYTNLTDGAKVTATLNVSYSLNGVTRVASGSPATITFTVQGD